MDYDLGLKFKGLGFRVLGIGRRSQGSEIRA